MISRVGAEDLPLLPLPVSLKQKLRSQHSMEKSKLGSKTILWGFQFYHRTK